MSVKTPSQLPAMDFTKLHGVKIKGSTRAGMSISVSEFMARFGKKGGLAKSPAKTAAARKNAEKAGRKPMPYSPIAVRMMAAKKHRLPLSALSGAGASTHVTADGCIRYVFAYGLADAQGSATGLIRAADYARMERSAVISAVSAATKRKIPDSGAFTYKFVSRSKRIEFALESTPLSYPPDGISGYITFSQFSKAHE